MLADKEALTPSSDSIWVHARADITDDWAAGQVCFVFRSARFGNVGLEDLDDGAALCLASLIVRVPPSTAMF